MRRTRHLKKDFQKNSRQDKSVKKQGPLAGGGLFNSAHYGPLVRLCPIRVGVILGSWLGLEEWKRQKRVQHLQL